MPLFGLQATLLDVSLLLLFTPEQGFLFLFLTFYRRVAHMEQGALPYTAVRVFTSRTHLCDQYLGFFYVLLLAYFWVKERAFLVNLQDKHAHLTTLSPCEGFSSVLHCDKEPSQI